MINGADNPYQLVTYHGPSDLRNLTPAQVQTDIPQHVHQDTLVLLHASQFNLTSTSTDNIELMSSIQDWIIWLAFNQILYSLFNKWCPNYSDQPHVALEHVKQTYTDHEGTVHSSSVHTYYQKIWNNAWPFSSQPTFPISLCNKKFINGLDPWHIQCFNNQYPGYAIIHPLDGLHQNQDLAILLSRSMLGSPKSKVQQVTPMMANLSFTNSPAAAFPSQAESTIAKFKKSDSTSTFWCGCFGFGGPHAWTKKVGDNWVPKCLSATKPGITKQAAENYNAYKKRHKAKQK